MTEKELIVVAGPNGAGKTTFAEEFLREHPCVYLSADAIAAELAPENPTSQQITAGREFLNRFSAQLSGSDSFLVESTLAGLGPRRTFQSAREAGFRISIMFVYVDTVEVCLARIEERARKGGHNIPEVDVRRRFARSLPNFWHVYRQMAGDWMLVYNAENEFVDVAIGDRDALAIRHAAHFREFLSLAGARSDG